MCVCVCVCVCVFVCVRVCVSELVLKKKTNDKIKIYLKNETVKVYGSKL